MSRRQFCVLGLFLALFALFTPPYMGINAQTEPLPPCPMPSNRLGRTISAMMVTGI
jgi:hypothetical protein